MPQVIENVVCMHCGCACDDLTVTTEGDAIVRVERACPLAMPKWLAVDRRDLPAALIAGKPADLKLALHEAARLLAGARAPLVLGLTQSGWEAQRAAVALADAIGAVVDTGRSSASQLAFQEFGVSTCTWGEIAQRCDLIVFWGVDPQRTHPRFVERFVDAGRQQPQIVVVHAEPTGLDARAALRLTVQPGSDFEALWTLRALVAGVSIADGPQLAGWRDLAARLKSCRSSAICYGPALASGPTPHRTVEALNRLVTELHQHARCYACSLAGSGNQAGAENVLTWQTGFPAAVSLAQGYPQYGPGENGAETLLVRGEVDACLLVGSAAGASLSEAAREALARIPSIVLEPAAGDALPFTPHVRFVTSVAGVHHAGEVTRLDGVALPLRAVLSQHYPGEAEVLDGVRQALPK